MHVTPLVRATTTRRRIERALTGCEHGFQRCVAGPRARACLRRRSGAASAVACTPRRTHTAEADSAAASASACAAVCLGSAQRRGPLRRVASSCTVVAGVVFGVKRGAPTVERCHGSIKRPGVGRWGGVVAIDAVGGGLVTGITTCVAVAAGPGTGLILGLTQRCRNSTLDVLSDAVKPSSHCRVVIC